MMSKDHSLSAIDALKTDPDLHDYLVHRLGKSQLRRRLGVEAEHVADKFGQGRTFFNIENWSAAASVIRFVLNVARMSERGKANVLDFRVRQHTVDMAHLPKEFDGFTILQLSDLHLDVLPEFPDALGQALKGLEYDICVLTGDYRFLTHGPYESALRGLERICEDINRDIYAILGNHDSILMAREIESLDIQLLLNENIRLERAKSSIYLAGIDDPHYYAADNLENAYEAIPDDAVSLLLAHSPEIYRHAAYTGFDFMMCGHTHAGQICLPGSFALTYNSSAPRFTGAGAWSYNQMQGYTSAGTGSSVVPARFNCPPEITLHRLRLAR